ncbi:MAG: YggT family protein [Bacillota bacterium]
MLILRAIDTFFNILYMLILVRVLLSWFGQGIQYNSSFRGAINFVYGVTEPILKPIRELLPTSGMGIDFSPIVAFFLLRIARSILMSLFSTMIF